MPVGLRVCVRRKRKRTFPRYDLRRNRLVPHLPHRGQTAAEEYLAAANAVVANPAAFHTLQAEDGDDLYFLESTGEFVVVSPAGYIRTYYLTDRDYFERQ